jgi:hypothetical protein
MADAAPAPAPAAPPAAEAESSAGEAPPTFTTRVPPAAELHYELRRGVLSGQGLLSWRPAGDHYDLQIDGNAFGVPVLVQHSSGGFDRAGWHRCGLSTAGAAATSAPPTSSATRG